MLNRLLLPFTVFLCLTGVPAHAQYTAKQLVFKYSAPYASVDLESTAGLKPGTSFSAADLQAAAQRLIDTGAFDDVQVALEGPFKAINITFTLKPVDASHLMHAGFENFIWWQSDQLDALIHAKVPLFHDTLPEAGNLQDAVTTALQQMLVEKNITATISRAVLEPSVQHPNRIVEYRIDKPAIRLSAIKLTGVSPSFQPAIDKATASAIGQSYDEGLTAHSIPDQILRPYQDLGYLEASITHLDRTPINTADHINVEMSATVHEGEPYHLSKLQWAGSPFMTTTDFDAASKLRPEDVASRKSLNDSLNNLATAYRSNGYMDATVVAAPALDASTHHVAYTVSVNPGQQYHLRSINAANLTPAQRKDFDSAWKLQSGDIYNAEYAATFLTKNTALRSFEGYSASYKALADPETHLVDLTITFVSGGNLIHVTAN